MELTVLGHLLPKAHPPKSGPRSGPDDGYLLIVVSTVVALVTFAGTAAKCKPTDGVVCLQKTSKGHQALYHAPNRVSE